MFRKSLFLVLTVVVVVFASAFTSQMVLFSRLPSAYDPGLSIDEAFKTSKHPLLIEFYTDSCGSCREVTPVVHDLYKNHYQDKLTLVMLDVEDPDVVPVARLFGVQSIPAVYVFDFHHMKKHDVPIDSLLSRDRLTRVLDKALQDMAVSSDTPAVRPMKGPA